MAINKHSKDITQRFILLMKEVIQSGQCENKSAFAVSVGEYQQNLNKMEDGIRAPTIEHITKACLLYGYSANWIMLNQGDKKLKKSESLPIEQRVYELEIEVAKINRTLKKR